MRIYVYKLFSFLIFVKTLMNHTVLIFRSIAVKVNVQVNWAIFP